MLSQAVGAQSPANGYGEMSMWSGAAPPLPYHPQDPSAHCILPRAACRVRSLRFVKQGVSIFSGLSHCGSRRSRENVGYPNVWSVGGCLTDLDL